MRYPAQFRCQIPIACEAIFEGEAKSFGTVLCFLYKGWVICLGLIDQRFVVAEIHVAQLGMPIEAQRVPDKGVELAHEEIRQVEGVDFIAGGKCGVAFKETVAVRALDHLHPQLCAARFEQAACAAIGVNYENALVLVAVAVNGLFYRVGDAFGVVVQNCRQAGEIEVRPAIAAGDIKNFAGECAAGQQKHFAGTCWGEAGVCQAGFCWGRVGVGGHCVGSLERAGGRGLGCAYMMAEAVAGCNCAGFAPSPALLSLNGLYLLHCRFRIGR